MKNRRILFVIPSMQPGGAERIVSVMANFWAQKNYDVSIISFDTKTSFYPLNEKISYYNLNSDEEKYGFFNSIFNNYLRIFNYFKYIKKAKANIIISFTRNANVYCLLYNFFLKRDLIISERTNPHFSILPKGLNRLPHLIYKYANGIVVQTPETLQIFNELKIALPQKKKIIFNLIDKTTFGNVYKGKRRNVILAVGRLENAVKQFDKLINIFNASENNGWELHIAGNGPDYQNLQVQINKLDLEKKVFLLGSITQLGELYQSSKIFVLTSSREGFPNALCEAMANGCACVSYNCATGPSTIINHSVNGILVEAGNEEKFREELSVLMKDEIAIQRLSAEAIKIAEVLDENKIIAQWESFIDEIVPVLI